jgi:hypothetical protein
MLYRHGTPPPGFLKSYDGDLKINNSSAVFNWVCNFFVAFVCPILLDKSVFSAYFLFGGCTALATIVSFFYMVETRGKSLAEIEAAFNNKRSAGGTLMSRISHAIPARAPKVS